MQINFKINIDDRIISFIKRLLTRKNIVAIVIVAAIGSSVYLYAALDIMTTMNNISAGDSIDLSQMQTVFQNIEDEVNDNGSQILALQSTGRLVDVTGGNLGLALESDYFDATSSVTVLSPAGFIYKIGMNGAFQSTVKYETQVYFTGAGCSGTPYIYADASSAVQMKRNSRIVIDYGNGFHYKPVITSGNINFVASNVSIASYRNFSNGICYSWNFVSDEFIEMETATNANLGLPVTFSTPFKIEP